MLFTPLNHFTIHQLQSNSPSNCIISHPPQPFTMANDAALKTSLLWLAAIICVVGICTHSMKKMMVTYVLGVVGISGLLLPDWDYFNRDFSRWGYPMTAEERASPLAQGSGFLRFAKSPLRVIAYSLIYGYAMCKWWEYVSG